MKKIIPWSQAHFVSNEKFHLNKAFDSTWVSGGEYVQKFEKEFCKYIKSDFAISVNNGTSAIHLAYLALKLKAGDEIIIPSFGYLAAANLALLMNLKPVFADVDLDTFCVDFSSIKKKITKKTKLIVVINTYGNVCDLKPILRLAKLKKINVLEDSAESLGSKYYNKNSGILADIGTFSFQATKTITTGEGGMVITKKSKEFKDLLNLYRNHGIKNKRYMHLVPGHNFRLTNLQAAIGYTQLKNFNKILKNREKSYNLYKKLLQNIKGIKLQQFKSNVRPLVWTMAMVLDKNIFGSRDSIIKKMLKKKIETRNGFYSTNRLKIFKKFHSKDLKNSDYLSRNVICLPLFNGIKNSQIKYIAKCLINLRK